MAVCANCGAENPDGFRFCPRCGASVHEVTVPRETRKVVTALFCDVTGSTALGEELDPEVLRGVMNRYFAMIRATIERHGGTVDKFIGDAVMAVFGIPRVQEDDALRAVRAAAEIRERLPAVAAEVGVTLRFRTGVNTGPVVMGEGGNLAIGDAVTVAARLEQAAAPGEIVLGADTLQLVRDAVEVEALDPLSLKGKSEPVQAFRLLRVDPVAAGVARRLDVPLVGRERELRRLGDAWERTVEDSGCHLFTLLGSAGVGKSRLVAEVLSGIGGRATVLRGRCLHYGEGITFWPLAEALAPIGARAQPVLERLERGGSATPEELFYDVRRLLESLAAERPVILHVDDLQWGESMLFDLLDNIADLSRGAPILLLCTARPELLEERPGWGGGKLNATTILLEPLAAAESRALLDRLADGLALETRERIVAAGEGNPLFLEEMVALARERGSVEVPPTIQALLAARLEQLAPEEREVLERGAVEGEVFHRLAVRALAGEGLARAVEPPLAGLVRKELIRPHPATLPGDEAFRFRHLLIRDAAYDGLPKATRAELHERFAAWLEEHAQQLVELDEIVGWHLEQAVRYAHELARAARPSLARDAAVHLHQGGVRAYQRSDPAAARNLFERALKLVTEPEPLHAVICVDLAELLIDTGHLARADELLGVGERTPETAAVASLHRMEWLFHARPHELTDRIESQLPALLDEFTRTGDERGLAKAHLVAWSAHWLAGRANRAGEEAWLAAEHARAAGDPALLGRALDYSIRHLARGPQHVREIAPRLDEIAAEARGPYLTASVMLGRGYLALLEGRLDDARELMASAIDGFATLGARVRVAGCMQILSEVERAAANLSAARAHLLTADRMAAEFGERSARSTLQAELADVEEQLGNRVAARAGIERAEELSAPEDAINFAITHAIRARLALADGDSAAAERWARSSVRFAFLTNFLETQAESTLDLARVLSAQGRIEEASAEAHRALELSGAKGDRPRLAAARAFLATLSNSA